MFYVNLSNAEGTIKIVVIPHIWSITTITHFPPEYIPSCSVKHNSCIRSLLNTPQSTFPARLFLPDGRVLLLATTHHQRLFLPCRTKQPPPQVIKQPPSLFWSKGGYKEIVAISVSVFLLYRIHTIMSICFFVLYFYYVVDIRLCQRCFISKSSYTPSYLTPFYPELLRSVCETIHSCPLRSLNNPTHLPTPNGWSKPRIPRCKPTLRCGIRRDLHNLPDNVCFRPGKRVLEYPFLFSQELSQSCNANRKHEDTPLRLPSPARRYPVLPSYARSIWSLRRRTCI